MELLDLEPIKARRNDPEIGPSWEAGGLIAKPEMFEEEAYVFPTAEVRGPICLASGLARAVFIAHAPVDIDALIAEVERSRKTLRYIATDTVISLDTARSLARDFTDLPPIAELEPNDYGYLRDVIDEAFDPADDDIPEVEILANAVRQAATDLAELRAQISAAARILGEWIAVDPRTRQDSPIAVVRDGLLLEV